MLPASEVVAQKAQGQEVAHAAQLMGLRVNKRERRSEEEVIQMRVSACVVGENGLGWVAVLCTSDVLVWR